MSTISANPFALLGGGDSDDDGGGVASKSVKLPPPSVAPQPKKPVPGQPPKRDRADYPARGAPRKVFGGHSATVDQAAVVTQSPTAGLAYSGRDDRAERRDRGGRGRGPRGARGGRGRGAGRADERPDRHSAIGTHDSDRKVASGWGAEEGQQELKAETEGWRDAKADMNPAGDANKPDGAPGAPVANGGSSPGQPAEGEVPEDNVKTFEEYLAEKANAVSHLPVNQREIRKPNEGADDSQWKGAVKLVKGEEEEQVFLQIHKDKRPVHNTSIKKTKEKTYIEVEPLGYRPPQRAGFDRGRGRGGARGRGDRDDGGRRDFGDNRGSGRGGRGRGGRGAYSGGPRELNTEDANAFPSLS